MRTSCDRGCLGIAAVEVVYGGWALPVLKPPPDGCAYGIAPLVFSPPRNSLTA